MTTSLTRIERLPAFYLGLSAIENQATQETRIDSREDPSGEIAKVQTGIAISLLSILNIMAKEGLWK